MHTIPTVERMKRHHEKKADTEDRKKNGNTNISQETVEVRKHFMLSDRVKVTRNVENYVN